MTKKRKGLMYIGFILLVQVFFLSGCSKQKKGFIEEEVVFKNELDGSVFTGTLTKPAGKELFPVAVLISGAGQQDRDESVYGHKPFKVLAEFLSNNGIGVLRYDDRGIGGSKGDVWNATLEVQASDAYSGIQYLKSRTDVDTKNIGIIGHSLGAMQGTILANQHRSISFLVMLGGIGIPWCENHIKADRLSNEMKGEPIEVIDAGTNLLELLFKTMKSVPDNQDYQTTKNALIQITEEWQASLSGKAKAKVDEFTKSNPGFWTHSIAEEYATPVYLSLVKYDPSFYLAKIQCPVLSMIGEKDIQVVNKNNDAIKRYLKKGGNQNHLVLSPKNINHMFQHCETGLLSEYEKLDEDFNLNLMVIIADWINENQHQ